MKTELELRRRMAADLRRAADVLDAMPADAAVNSIDVQTREIRIRAGVSWETFEKQFAGRRVPVRRVNDWIHVEAERDGITWAACDHDSDHDSDPEEYLMASRSPTTEKT